MGRRIFPRINRKEGEGMHKFIRTIGFSMYQKKQDMDKLAAAPCKGGPDYRLS